MQVYASSHAKIMALFTPGNPSVGQKAQETKPPADLPVAKDSEMQGVYTDPRISKASQKSDTDLAIRAIQEIWSIRDNELKAVQAEAKTNLEEEIGRKFKDGEGFKDLSIHEQSKLSKSVLNESRDALLSGYFISFAAADYSHFEANSLTLNYVNGPSPEPKETRETNSDDMIEMLASLQIGGIKMGFSNGGVSEDLMKQALSAAGATDLDALKDSLLAYHRERYENGDLTLAYDGHVV